MRRRMSPPRTIRRVHGANYGGCLIYMVAGASVVIAGILKVISSFI